MSNTDSESDPMPAYVLRADCISSLAALEALRMYLYSRKRDEVADAVWEVRSIFIRWQQRNIDKLTVLDAESVRQDVSYPSTG